MSDLAARKKKKKNGKNVLCGTQNMLMKDVSLYGDGGDWVLML